ncbi:MAG: TlpA family protein disulfide reductase [Bacteroidota bacterium]|nr:TlpA family protein disulfide reductase [Bacteroidota bacterium]
MRVLSTMLLSGLLLLLFSCDSNHADVPVEQPQTGSKKTKSATASPQEDIVIDREAILKDFGTWYNYTYYTIRLAQDFIGLSADSVTMRKAAFLTQLETGNYVPFKIKEKDKKPVYKLYPLQHGNEDIRAGIKQLAAIEKEHFKMEGSELPDFDFADVNGKKYSKATTKGNILLLKCWFINCVACVQEFPALNKLVDKYNDRNDLRFVSLATDSKEKLLPFLSKRNFNYAVVPLAGEYMTDKLKVTEYPTHILVDRNGKIVKVTNTVEDMIPSLEQQIGKTSL